LRHLVVVSTHLAVRDQQGLVSPLRQLRNHNTISEKQSSMGVFGLTLPSDTSGQSSSLLNTKFNNYRTGYPDT
jgi:hypothetical protein